MNQHWLLALVICCCSSALASDLSSVQTAAQPGTVVLTFDDGPTAEFTPQILAILKKYHVKATFFMVGKNMQAHPDIVKQVMSDGHAIANHSNTHPDLTKLNDADLQKEVSMPVTIIHHLTGKLPVCLRFPYNATNKQVDEVIQQNNMVPVDVGFNANDYKRPGVTAIVNRVVSNASSGRVFVMHDGFAHREQTVAALPLIIEGIQRKGLGFSQICVN